MQEQCFAIHTACSATDRVISSGHEERMRESRLDNIEISIRLFAKRKNDKEGYNPMTRPGEYHPMTSYTGRSTERGRSAEGDHSAERSPSAERNRVTNEKLTLFLRHFSSATTDTTSQNASYSRHTELTADVLPPSYPDAVKTPLAHRSRDFITSLREQPEVQRAGQCFIKLCQDPEVQAYCQDLMETPQYHQAIAKHPWHHQDQSESTQQLLNIEQVSGMPDEDDPKRQDRKSVV